MKVLFLPSFYCAPHHPVLGVFVRDQARALVNSGIEVNVLVNEARSLRDLSLSSLLHSHWQRKLDVEEGIFTMRQCGWNLGVRYTCGGRLWIRMVVALFGKYFLSGRRPDVVHAHNTIWAGCAAHQIWERYGVPFVLTEHSTAFLASEIPQGADALVKAVGIAASARIAVSNALAAAYQSYVNVPVQVIPNLIETSYFTPPVNIRNREMFSYLAVGNLVERKGFHLLLDAFAAKFSTTNNVMLRIGGAGPERNRLEHLACDLGIRSKVEFLGLLNREKVRSAMQTSNTLVLPSFWETFGVVLIEAMSTGIPVIASRCGGPEGIITADTGLLISPGNVEELGNALVEVRERTWNADQIRYSVRARYDSGVIAEALTNIYRLAIKPIRLGNQREQRGSVLA